MNWRALILLVVALSIYAPFAGQSTCAQPSCCAQMHSCCGHCSCPPKQTCSVAKPAAIDQQTLARTAQLPPRVEVELFTLALDRAQGFQSDRHVLSRLPESPPIDTSQASQARLCLWLI
jgi:hypothetical protein